jgi:hypothetical protein
MAGEGLIWAGIGQGIANAGSTMGQFLMRSQERESEREYRDKLEQERREYRDKTDQEKREYRAEQDAIYKRTAADQNAGRAGAGKDQDVQLEDLAPGGRAANLAANTLGMSEERYGKFYKANKTDDYSEFARPIGKTLDDEYGVQTVTEVPQALKEEFALKRKELGRLQEAFAFKDKYDDVMKGRDTGFKTGMGQAAFDRPEVAPRAGQAVSASEGKPLINIEGGQQYNQFTGTGSTTPLGKSQIAENQAKAGEAKQKGDAAETKAERQEKDKRETTKDLERRIENNLAVLHEKLGVNKNDANDTLKRLRDKATKDPDAAKRLKELQPLIDKVDASRAKLDAWEAKAAAPAPAPAPAVKALPSGAVLVGKSGGKNVYQLPDGTRYIQK